MEKHQWNWLGMAIVAVILILLLNPDLLPFLPESLRATVSAQMSKTFGNVLAGDSLAITMPRLLALVAMILALWLLARILEYLIQKAGNRNAHQRTISGLLVSVVKYSAVIIGIIWGFSIMGVNVSAILASLGIIGLIVGFGAQSLIEDIITGMFIIFEQQYEVGDIIVLDDFRGIVRRIEVRTTMIEDDGGNLKVVNNSDIRNFQNRSRLASCAVADVKVAYDTDQAELEKVLEDCFKHCLKAYPDLFLRVPEYLGVQELTDMGYQIRCVADVRESDVYRAQRTLNSEILKAFNERGISIAHSASVPSNLKH